MKLRNLSLALVASVVLYSCGSSETSTETTSEETVVETTYSIDPASTVAWKGNMVGMYSHNGTVNVSQGSLSVKGDSITAGTFTIDMKSINPLDSGYSEEHPREGLIGHLAQPEFFSTDTFPTATFVVKSFEGTTATGDLTIKGQTNEEKVTDIVLTSDSASVSATGKLLINRQKYGVAFAMTVKDMVLSDDIEFTVNLVGKK